MRSDGIIGDIYDAALRPELWPSVLERLRQVFDAAAVTVVPLRNPTLTVASPGSAEALDAYARGWWREDILTKTAVGKRLTGLCVDWDFIDERKMRSDAFYQDFRRPFGFERCLGFIDGGGTEDAVTLSIHMPIGWQIETDHARELPLIGRHVGRAAMMSRLTAVARAAEALIEEVLCALPTAAAIIDGSGRVLFSNDALGRLAGDGLRIEKGRLRAAIHRDQAPLDLLVARARAVDGGEAPSLLQLSRPTGRRPLVVCIARLGRAGCAAVGGRDTGAIRSMVFILDSDAELAARSEVQLLAFGLTPSEARTASLIGTGLSPIGVAVTLGVTENTVRTTLKRIFEKMATSRQSELSYLVGRLTTLP